MNRILFTGFLLVIILSCKSSGSKDSTAENPLTATETSPSNDSRQTINPADSLSKATGSQSAVEEKPLVPAKPKICAPNFTKLYSPKKNQYIYLVTNFNPDEFKCWVELETHGAKICAGSPCMVYYVDQAGVKVTTTPPNYLDDNTLKESGIGRYEYNGKYWELKAASIWKRKGNGYGYYNTDNQLGG